MWAPFRPLPESVISLPVIVVGSSATVPAPLPDREPEQHERHDDADLAERAGDDVVHGRAGGAGQVPPLAGGDDDRERRAA